MICGDRCRDTQHVDHQNPALGRPSQGYKYFTVHYWLVTWVSCGIAIRCIIYVIEIGRCSKIINFNEYSSFKSYVNQHFLIFLLEH